jgi:hypothetical protein
LLRGVAAAQVPDFAGLFLANDTRQQGRAKTGVHRADTRAGLAELGVFRRNRQVANGDQHIAAANGKAIDTGNHRLAAVADGALHFFNRQADHAPATVAAVLRALVSAGAKGFFASTGEHHHANAAVVVSVLERVDHFLAGVGGEGVVLLGPVDGDGGNAIEPWCRGCRCRPLLGVPCEFLK